MHDDESAFAFEDDLPESVDRAAIRRMRAVARILDESVRVPGTNIRVGLDPLLGLVPGGGDLLGAGLSMYIVVESARLGVSYTTLVRMLVNIGVDATVGSIPYAGDLFDVFWKANVRNVELAVSDLVSKAARDDAGGDGGPIRIDID